MCLASSAQVDEKERTQRQTADEKHKGVLNAQVTHTHVPAKSGRSTRSTQEMLNRGTVSTVTQGFVASRISYNQSSFKAEDNHSIYYK